MVVTEKGVTIKGDVCFKKQKWTGKLKYKREGEQGRQNKQRKEVRDPGPGKLRKTQEKTGEGSRRRRKAYTSHLRKTYHGDGPQTTPEQVIPPSFSPLAAAPPPLPSMALLGSGSGGFPAVGLFLKTPMRSPACPALTLWPQGPQPSPGTPPSCGEVGRRKKDSQP